MSGSWIEAIVWFKDSSVWESRREIALAFIKPTVEELWKEKAIEFFHYFFEPELHLRLYSEKESFDEIIDIIRKNLKPLESHLLRPVEFNDYQSGYENFLKHTGSKKAWFIGRSFFMENSGTALHFLELLDKKTIFNPTNWMFDRFLHSFCNELGFTHIEEGKMLFEYSILRATAETRNRKDREGTEKILEHFKQELQSLTTKLLQQ